jgi:hypothetical protein
MRHNGFFSTANRLENGFSELFGGGRAIRTHGTVLQICRWHGGRIAMATGNRGFEETLLAGSAELGEYTVPVPLATQETLNRFGRWSWAQFPDEKVCTTSPD